MNIHCIVSIYDITLSLFPESPEDSETIEILESSAFHITKEKDQRTGELEIVMEVKKTM